MHIHKVYLNFTPDTFEHLLNSEYENVSEVVNDTDLVLTKYWRSLRAKGETNPRLMRVAILKGEPSKIVQKEDSRYTQFVLDLRDNAKQNETEIKVALAVLKHIRGTLICLQ